MVRVCGERREVPLAFGVCVTRAEELGLGLVVLASLVVSSLVRILAPLFGSCIIGLLAVCSTAH